MADIQQIRTAIEHTNLKPTITDRDVDRLVAEAKNHSFFGVCVPPFWVKRAHREINDGGLKLITVIGFPLGYQMTEIKLEEIRMAMDSGVDELDVVINISAFKINMDWFKIDLAKCSKLIHSAERILKVIIETSYLTESEIKRVCKICTDIGADFVKTSTGFAPSGARTEDIEIIKSVLPPTVGIKASGGIKTLEQCRQMLAAGATRIGTSSGIEIINSFKK